MKQSNVNEQNLSREKHETKKIKREFKNELKNSSQIRRKNIIVDK